MIYRYKVIYRYKGRTSDEEFNKYDNALDLIDKIKNREIKLVEEKNDQEKFRSDLSGIKRGSKKSKEQKNTICNISTLYKARKDAIKFFDDYSSVVSGGKSKAKNKTRGKGLKILTPKQLLQRLPIALA